jgi:two-component system sensor histidine kinase EvgS
MVVDDDPVSRLMLSSRLIQFGLKPESVASRQDAMEVLETCRPSIVLVDVDLPDGSRYRLAQGLREADRRTSSVPLLMIALSSRTDAIHLEKCSAAGIQKTLCKSASSSALAAILGLAAPAPYAARSAVGGLPEQEAQRLGALYRETCLQDLAALKTAWHKADARAVRFFAHRIRGASLQVGASAAAHLAAFLAPGEGVSVVDRGASTVALRWLERLLKRDVFIDTGAS